jgi:lipopolysaccharide transport system permease protein
MDKTEKVIESRSSFTFATAKEVFEYWDLVKIFVYRDFVAQYKQTILGPIWFILQPVLSSLVFFVIFYRIANIKSTENLHPFLFYFSGLICWNYVAECFLKTSNSLIDNRVIFGKVYFPRLVVPISISISNLLKLCLQTVIFYIFYFYLNDFSANTLSSLFLLPMLVMNLVVLGLGGGLLFSSLTTKYRDLNFLISFGVQLLMYLSPVIYSSSDAKNRISSWIFYNPLVYLIDGFRSCLIGGGINWSGLAYSYALSIIIFLVGLISFNKAQQSFVDLS